MRPADPGSSEQPVEPRYLLARFHRVPTSFTQLIGREHEIEAVCALLMRPEVRLLTLTGTGGIGKTRLAVQVAADLQYAFADGFCCVYLASTSTSDLLPLTIVQALGLKGTRNLPLFEQLETFLQDKHFLLVLDNFEQIVAGASLLVELLSACSRLKILVTSRAVLRVQGEYEFSVHPLALPDLTHLPNSQALVHYPAVALFMQRAQAIKPDFQLTETNAPLIAAICTRLGGLPLAVELAAARIKLLAPQALLSRLEHPLEVLTRGGPDLPVRHQTLRNTLAWSYNLLSAEDQWLFRQLSVFVDGCRLEVGEAVCTALGGVTTPVLDGVALLVDKSLLQRVEQEGDESRFVMLETVREYGLECLATCGELESSKDAHAAYYLALAEEAALALRGMHQGMWLKQLERERANMQAALHWLLEQEETEAALRLATGLGQFCFLRGYLSEGRSFLERALAASSEDKASVSIQVKANALYVAGRLAYWQNDAGQTMVLLEESERLFRNLGDKRGRAASLSLLGSIKNNRGDTEVGGAMYEESLRLYREIGDNRGTAEVLMTLGARALSRGEFARVRDLCEESLALSKEVEDSLTIATNLHFLAWASYCQGEYATARQLSEESLARFRTVGNTIFIAEALTVLAYEATALGDETIACSLLEEALALGREAESTEDVARALCGLGRLALRQGNVTKACALYEESLMMMKGTYMIRRARWVIASCLEGLGEIAFAQGQAEQTVRLFSAAEAVRTRNGHRSPLGIDHPFYERTLAGASAQLGEETFAVAWAEGQTMTPEQALAAEARTSIITRPPSPSPSGLTTREVEVLRALAMGLTNNKIAERLVISPRTVNVHVQSIYSKLGISSRSAATRYAMKHHLV